MKTGQIITAELGHVMGRRVKLDILTAEFDLWMSTAMTAAHTKYNSILFAYR